MQPSASPKALVGKFYINDLEADGILPSSGLPPLPAVWPIPRVGTETRRSRRPNCLVCWFPCLHVNFWHGVRRHSRGITTQAGVCRLWCTVVDEEMRRKGRGDLHLDMASWLFRIGFNVQTVRYKMTICSVCHWISQIACARST